MFDGTGRVEAEIAIFSLYLKSDQHYVVSHLAICLSLFSDIETKQVQSKKEQGAANSAN